MAKKFYAVKHGRQTGIFLTWEACRAQVEGVSGATYKGFATEEEALAYLDRGNTLGVEEKTDPSQGAPAKKEGAVAYVDGSFLQATREFACGAILFYEGEQVLFSQKYQDAEMAEMRNVAGEIMGAVTVIRYCVERKIPALEIYHDYEGIAKWALGEWKTNKTGTKAYAQICREASQKLKLTFQKVKGHSGDVYNDIADRLARKALGLDVPTEPRIPGKANL